MKIENLSHYYGKKEILKIDHLCINEDKITALMGSNGSGKSTLLRIISGIENAKNAQISTNLDKKDISILLPEPVLLKRSVLKNFEFVAKNYEFFDEFDARIDEIFKLLNLEFEFLGKNFYELSSGQIQRIAIALVLFTRSKFIILDEPTNSLDLSFVKLVSKAILYMKKRYNCGFLISSHDEKWLSAICDENIFLHNGRLSKFELKNLFNIDDVLNFDIPMEFKKCKKIAINPNVILLSNNKKDGYKKALVHSVSIIYNDRILIKIKVGDFLIKVIKNLKDVENRYTTGNWIYFKIPNKAYFALE